MDDNKFQDLIIHELRALKNKIDDQHERMDLIAQELVRIDTERKTAYSVKNVSWEKMIAVIGCLGIGAGLIVALI